MTPEEKAEELIKRFTNVPIYINQEPRDIDSTMSYIDNDAVKQCAIITVEEILKTYNNDWCNLDFWTDELGTTINFWNTVLDVLKNKLNK